ncbi:MAG: hypothetical protein IJO29_06490 [Oscillospiraceae bacterium]|nr:hypothetical protein [Oscillospiraceae bacterium]
MVVKVFLICFLALFLERFLINIFCDFQRFGNYIKENGFSLLGIIGLIDFKWIFTARRTEKRPKGQFVKADAQVVEAEKEISEFYDENEGFKQHITYRLKIRYYVGTQSVTTYLDSESMEDEVEIFYNVDNPYEVQLASKSCLNEKTEAETINNIIEDIAGFVAFIVTVFYIFDIFIEVPWI